MIDKLIRDFAEFNFASAEVAHWNSNEKTVYFNDDIFETFHELGHAILNHSNINNDVEILKQERAAWNKAFEVAKKYKIEIPEEIIEDHLDSYRLWLHQKSKCPACEQNGIQQDDGNYFCIICEQRWRTNDARQARHLRTKLQ